MGQIFIIISLNLSIVFISICFLSDCITEKCLSDRISYQLRVSDATLSLKISPIAKITRWLQISSPKRGCKRWCQSLLGNLKFQFIKASFISVRCCCFNWHLSSLFHFRSVIGMILVPLCITIPILWRWKRCPVLFCFLVIAFSDFFKIESCIKNGRIGLKIQT